MNIPEEILRLIFKKEFRALTPEENSQLDNWLNLSDENLKISIELSNLMRSYITANQFLNIDSEKAWKRIKYETDQKSPNKIRFLKLNRIVAAAVIISFIALGSLLYYVINNFKSNSFENIKAGSPKAILELASEEKLEINGNKAGFIYDKNGTEIGLNSLNTLVCFPGGTNINAKNTLIVPFGSMYKLVLNDGTIIRINSGSRIRYPVAFAIDNRFVELEGEAYFDVAKDITRPFIVRTRNSDIVVTGTKFNISSYRDDIFEHITLAEGKVSVNTDKNITNLLPDEQYYFDKTSESFKVNKVETLLYTSWKDGIYRFQNMELEQLTTKIQRWFNIKFAFKDKECAALRFTGAFDYNDNLGEFVKIIESTTSVHFEKNGDIIYVSFRE